MFNQPMLVANESGYYGTGAKMAIDPKYCLVPRALKAQAEALFMPRWASSADAISAAGGPTFGGHVVPITVPEWTDATDWAAVADPLIVPGICIGERFGLLPEVFIAGDETDPAMLANDVQLGFGTFFGVRPHMISKRLNVLAITAGKRSSALPDIPTVAEAGVPGYEVDQWYGVLTGAKVPQPIIRKLSLSINEALKSPEIIKRFGAEGSTPRARVT